MSTLIRFHYDPFGKLEHFSDDAFNARVYACPSLGRAGRSVSNNATQFPRSFHPRMDVKESEEPNTVTAMFELPGLKHEDVTIDIQQNRLTVSGESAAPSHSPDENGYTVRERRYGKFSRTIQLPFGTKPEDVKAKLENGLLTVTFPKTTPEQQPQRISIQ